MRNSFSLTPTLSRNGRGNPFSLGQKVRMKRSLDVRTFTSTLLKSVRRSFVPGWFSERGADQASANGPPSELVLVFSRGALL